MYILSCAAIVFTCLSASKRMRKLNAELENTALVEVAVAPGQLVASASSHGDDSRSSLVSTRDLTDVHISSANAAVRGKVRT
jgi:predicted DsbA family dithiol-disulfide isomerase